MALLIHFSTKHPMALTGCSITWISLPLSWL